MTDFEITDATRTAQSVSIGLFGPSGCGKTLSALRLAVGIQSVVGGNIYLIDTEARRAKDYAPKEDEAADNVFTFNFKHVDFEPPFGSDRYLEAIEKCRADGPSGPRTVIIDSLSHEHESEGGMLEQFEKELERLGGGDKNNARAWIKPKAKRRKLVVRMEQMRDVNFILTFRAADQTKPGKDSTGKNTFVHLGYVPIGGREFVFCTKACAFLPPSADGIPDWNPEFVGEKMMRRLPGFLAPILRDGKPLSQDHGAAIAQWSLGGSKPTHNDQKPSKTLAERAVTAEGFLRAAKSGESVEKRWVNLKGLCDELRDPIAQVDPHLFADLKAVYTECAAKFAKKGAFEPPEPGGEPPEGPMSIEYAKDIANRVEVALLKASEGSKSKAELALSELTAGKVQQFVLLATYIFDHNEIVGKLIGALEGK